MSGLELEGVSKHYGAFRAMRSVDLSVAPGEFVAMAGPSGCGNSTLPRTIAGLHLLYASPIRRGTLRGDAVQPIQDIVPLSDVRVEVEAEGVSAVRLVPEVVPLDCEAAAGRVRFTVPRVVGHQMVELRRDGPRETGITRPERCSYRLRGAARACA